MGRRNGEVRKEGREKMKGREKIGKELIRNKIEGKRSRKEREMGKMNGDVRKEKGRR